MTDTRAIRLFIDDQEIDPVTEIVLMFSQLTITRPMLGNFFQDLMRRGTPVKITIKGDTTDTTRQYNCKMVNYTAHMGKKKKTTDWEEKSIFDILREK